MRYISERIINDEVNFVVISGDSSETKPTANICDGSIFMESDTGDSYTFNEKSGTWIKACGE